MTFVPPGAKTEIAREFQELLLLYNFIFLNSWLYSLKVQGRCPGHPLQLSWLSVCKSK